jgi:hypothetical protein
MRRRVPCFRGFPKPNSSPESRRPRKHGGIGERPVEGMLSRPGRHGWRNDVRASRERMAPDDGDADGVTGGA